MGRYVALLRGINVSGHKPIKMERLRAVFEGLGFDEVATYVQSGNVVFATRKVKSAALATKIAGQLEKDFGYAIPVAVLSADELETIVERNPFPSENGIDASKLHVTFLNAVPEAAALSKLGAIPAGRDRFVCRDQALYLDCPDGYGRSKLVNNVVERVLRCGATTRNWRTVTTLNEMCAAA